MSWNLPPGCTDKDIDDAAPQERREACSMCGRWCHEDEMEIIISKGRSVATKTPNGIRHTWEYGPMKLLCSDCHKVVTS